MTFRRVDTARTTTEPEVGHLTRKLRTTLA
jgi:hypothetical protein